MKIVQACTLFYLLILHSFNLYSQDIDQELRAIEIMRDECLKNLAYIIQDDMLIECNYTNQKYKSKDTPKNLEEKKSLKIAAFNILHPGNAKTMYKDIPNIARIINQYDIVAALELIPVVGDQFSHNLSIYSFLKKAPDFINITIDKILIEKSELEKKRQIDRLDQLVRDFEEASSLVRAPGYLEILKELHKLDPHWSLELSPRGEASKDTNQQELVGYFYRSSVVETIANPYCKSLPLPLSNNAETCLVLMGKEIFSQDFSTLFSRRPFMGSFRSASNEFTLLASHVVYTSDLKPERMQAIMQAAFQVDSPDLLGTGITKDNYARFAEIKLTLDFIQQLKNKFSMKNIIFLGDFNLEPQNQFWKTILPPEQELVLTHDFKTSVTPARLNAKGEETFGLSSSYDHMIISQDEFKNCQSEDGFNTGVFDFINEKNSILNRYNIKNLDELEQEQKINSIVGKFNKTHSNLKTIKYNQIIPDISKLSEKIQNYKDRVFKTQLEDATYYRHATELVSDHLPIWIECLN